MANHWYAQDGLPMYTVIGANGKERDTTLRDARKLNLVPSVTTIMSGAAKPGLDQYLQKQLLDAVVSIGVHDSDFWRQSVVAKSKEHSQNAATKGTAIHDALEHYYLTEEFKKGDSPLIKSQTLGPSISVVTVYYNWEEVLTPVIELLKFEFGDIQWEPERSFSHKDGFGGKVDMSHITNNFLDRDEHQVYHNNVILDFKTKDTDDIKKMIPYDEHGMQTAAYAVGLGIPNAKRYNLFISTQVPGLLNLTGSTDFDRDWGMFRSLLDYWQLKNKYVPGG